MRHSGPCPVPVPSEQWPLQAVDGEVVRIEPYRECEACDHAHALMLARLIAGREGSKWADIDQRLARAVLRLSADERLADLPQPVPSGLTRER